MEAVEAVENKVEWWMEKGVQGVTYRLTFASTIQLYCMFCVLFIVVHFCFFSIQLYCMFSIHFFDFCICSLFCSPPTKEESACACLQCLAMANPRNLTGVEDALLMALEAQGKSEAVQILRCQVIGSTWDVCFFPRRMSHRYR